MNTSMMIGMGILVFTHLAVFAIGMLFYKLFLMDKPAPVVQQDEGAFRRR